MKLQYTIASATSTEKLMEEVHARMKEGWIPQGGVSVANSSSLIFVQAMILKAQ